MSLRTHPHRGNCLLGGEGASHVFKLPIKDQVPRIMIIAASKLRLVQWKEEPWLKAETNREPGWESPPRPAGRWAGPGGGEEGLSPRAGRRGWRAAERPQKGPQALFSLICKSDPTYTFHPPTHTEGLYEAHPWPNLHFRLGTKNRSALSALI